MSFVHRFLYLNWRARLYTQYRINPEYLY